MTSRWSLDPTNLGTKLRWNNPSRQQVSQQIGSQWSCLTLKPWENSSDLKKSKNCYLHIWKTTYLPTFKNTVVWGGRFVLSYFCMFLNDLFICVSTFRNLHDLHQTETWQKYLLNLAESAEVQTQIIRATDAAPDLLSLNLSDLVSM